MVPGRAPSLFFPILASDSGSRAEAECFGMDDKGGLHMTSRSAPTKSNTFQYRGESAVELPESGKAASNFGPASMSHYECDHRIKDT